MGCSRRCAALVLPKSATACTCRASALVMDAPWDACTFLSSSRRTTELASGLPREHKQQGQSSEKLALNRIRTSRRVPVLPVLVPDYDRWLRCAPALHMHSLGRQCESCRRAREVAD